MGVAEALEPLYRSYLRRLDEMAARLLAEAVLTERTTRGEDGRLVMGAGGLPLRFDVADARDGHTYEVHGAHADEPAAAQVRVGRVEVRLEAGDWEGPAGSCRFERDPPPHDPAGTADPLCRFAVLALHSGVFAPRRRRSNYP